MRNDLVGDTQCVFVLFQERPPNSPIIEKVGQHTDGREFCSVINVRCSNWGTVHRPQRIYHGMAVNDGLETPPLIVKGKRPDRWNLRDEPNRDATLRRNALVDAIQDVRAVWIIERVHLVPSDNGRLLRVAAIDVHANGTVWHRRSETLDGSSILLGHVIDFRFSKTTTPRCRFIALSCLHWQFCKPQFK